MIPLIKAIELRACQGPPSYASGCISEGLGCAAGLSLPLHLPGKSYIDIRIELGMQMQEISL